MPAGFTRGQRQRGPFQTVTSKSVMFAARMPITATPRTISSVEMRSLLVAGPTALFAGRADQFFVGSLEVELGLVVFCPSVRFPPGRARMRPRLIDQTPKE